MIDIRNLNVSYFTGGGFLEKKKRLLAVENVSLLLQKGEITGLVGESGCGKSTLGKTILRLLKEESGSILVEGNDITALKNRELLPVRKKIQAIFQDPYASLNPGLNIFEIVSEGLSVFEKLSRDETAARVVDILKSVSIDENALYRYPHEFSGGQRQRIAIARALILNPEFVVCDEAVSALDVSTQAQVINLLKDMKEEKGFGYLFISHDLNVVKYISDKIAVMYLGKIVEYADTGTISNTPAHPYTVSLFTSVFDLHDRKKERKILTGEVPSILNKPDGCYFHTRCPAAKETCRTVVPEFREIKKGHFVSCHYI